MLPYLEAAFAATVWGASFIATKVALNDVSPITIVWLRFGIGLLVLGAAVALRKQFSLPKKNEWGYFALLGFLGITFHQWLQSNGLQTSEAGATAWIVATTPVFMAVLGWLILKEGLSLLKVFGIALAFFGVLLIISDGNLASISIGKFGAPGDALILVSAVNWAVVSVLSRRGLKTTSASLFVFYMMLFGWLFTSALIYRSPRVNFQWLAWSRFSRRLLFRAGVHRVVRRVASIDHRKRRRVFIYRAADRAGGRFFRAGRGDHARVAGGWGRHPTGGLAGEQKLRRG